MEDDDFEYCDDTDDVCDHDDYDTDILSGRAHCYRCGAAWWLTDKELSREIELSAQMFLCVEPDDGDLPF